ncbi:sugar-binding transcriptional regulator [Consotaella salsifontis]|uniref:DNA-binding transcriptional regulator LsrR, DeoR family n=1 Tax=Consotaella salsifontis TaxID=1365950 RepID=A0A1T4SMR8_9HYPH|nr:sugar-binding transcriptional regulator [Consotaella salsifontis]SKA29475.1 DNA-binding transcriptional regulator LsrR, DeoR family [Consotaella salsifontis]
MAKARGEAGRLDEAARAGWLYYVAGNTQDQIAAKLGVSRQTAQRLVSLSVSAGLIRVRLDHPIAACLELAEKLKKRFRLTLAEVVPTDPNSTSTILGVAEACAAEMERRLVQSDPLVLAVGTGRTLKAAVENLPKMSCPQHRVVSLTGNLSSDGSASVYNVVYVMADTLQEARHYPMPLPVVVSSPAERELLHEQKVVQNTLALVKEASVTFVGIGELGPAAPLLADGFISRGDVAMLEETGAVGEIVGWAFNRDGRLIDCPHNQRVASAPIPSTDRGEVIAVAMGPAKLVGTRAAIVGRLVNGVITDEATAAALLAE